MTSFLTEHAGTYLGFLVCVNVCLVVGWFFTKNLVLAIASLVMSFMNIVSYLALTAGGLISILLCCSNFADVNWPCCLDIPGSAIGNVGGV